MTVTVFMLCLAAGACCGITEGALHFPRKAVGSVFTVLTDVLLAAVSVGLHAVIIYLYCDGRIFPYAVIAQILGFTVSRSVIVKMSEKLKAKHPKRKTEKEKPVRTA